MDGNHSCRIIDYSPVVSIMVFIYFPIFEKTFKTMLKKENDCGKIIAHHPVKRA